MNFVKICAWNGIKTPLCHPHTCQQHHDDIQNSDSDYIELLNTVQLQHAVVEITVLEKRKMNQTLNVDLIFLFQPSMSTKARIWTY